MSNIINISIHSNTNYLKNLTFYSLRGKMYRPLTEIERETNDVVLLCTGSSLNDVTDREWKWLLKHDTLAVNNFVYHPWIVPKWNHLEIKSYDFPYQQRYLDIKWEKGWKNTGYIFPAERADYIASCIGHKDEAIIYTYKYKKRGEHPKINPNVEINANFNPNDGMIYKSYDASMTSIIQILYMMGYDNIIIVGMDMLNSGYFWSDWDIDVHDKHNKAREGKPIDQPHNASHLKDFVIDFNEKHMLPKGREICIVSTKTALYPALKLLKFTTKEKLK
jgi:hypothetical protein